MKLVVGLGNPGEKYETTRHNIGFMVLNHFAEKINIPKSKDVNLPTKKRVTQVEGVPTRAHLSNAKEHYREGNLRQDPHITEKGPAEKTATGPAKTINKYLWKNEYNSEITSLQISGHKILLAKPQTYMNNSGIAVSKLINKFMQNTEDLVVIHDDIDLPFGEIKVRKGGGAGGHNGITSIIENIGKKDFMRIKIGIGRPKKIMGGTSGSDRREIACSLRNRRGYPPSSARSDEGTRTSDGGGEVTGPIISNYVLQEFTKEEKERLPKIIENASSRLHKLLKFGYEEYASRHNK